MSVDHNFIPIAKIKFPSSFSVFDFSSLQFGLRQLDLSLLSQLWALNESIQEYRVMSQEQENFTMQSSSPSPSETVSISSTDDSNIVTSPMDNSIYNGRRNSNAQPNATAIAQPKPMTPRMQTAPPPPPTSTSASRSYPSRNQ